MSMCADKYTEYIHDYLDGDISREHEKELKNHLQQCSQCKQHMHELNNVVVFLKSASPIEVPLHFESNVMARLPKRKSTIWIQKWFRRHPIIVAAAMFLLFVSVTFLSNFANDTQFSVTKQPNLIVEGQTVIVPKGETVKGDLVVKNGDLVIEGEVDGNVTVINGKYMASTAVVTGQIQEIDQTFERVWYEMKQVATNVKSMVTDSE